MSGESDRNEEMGREGLCRRLLAEEEDRRSNSTPSAPPKGIYERILSEPSPKPKPVKRGGPWSGYRDAAERARRENPEGFANAQKQSKYFKCITTHPDLRGREWKPFQKEWLREARKGRRRFPEDEQGGFGWRGLRVSVGAFVVSQGYNSLS